MKQVVALLTLILLLFAATVPAAAATAVTDESGKVSFTLPDDYLVLTRDNLRRNAPVLESWGHTVDSFRRQLDELNAYLYAMDKQGNQIQLKSWQSDLSEGIGDLTDLDDAGRKTALDTIGLSISEEGKLLSSGTATADGQLFFSYEADCGDHCYVQYITVFDGSFYAAVYYNSSPELTAAERKVASELLATAKFKRSGGVWSVGTVMAIVLLSVGVLAAGALIVWVVLTFVSDVRRGKNNPDEVIPDQIKMRRK